MRKIQTLNINCIFSFVISPFLNLVLPARVGFFKALMEMMMKLFEDKICNSANVKNFNLRSHFSNPLDIDIFNRGDIEIFGQYIIQEKLPGKLYKRIS